MLLCNKVFTTCVKNFILKKQSLGRRFRNFFKKKKNMSRNAKESGRDGCQMSMQPYAQYAPQYQQEGSRYYTNAYMPQQSQDATQQHTSASAPQNYLGGAKYYVDPSNPQAYQDVTQEHPNVYIPQNGTQSTNLPQNSNQNNTNAYNQRADPAQATPHAPQHGTQQHTSQTYDPPYYEGTQSYSSNYAQQDASKDTKTKKIKKRRSNSTKFSQNLSDDKQQRKDPPDQSVTHQNINGYKVQDSSECHNNADNPQAYQDATRQNSYVPQAGTQHYISPSDPQYYQEGTQQYAERYFPPNYQEDAQSHASNYTQQSPSENTQNSKSKEKKKRSSLTNLILPIDEQQNIDPQEYPISSRKNMNACTSQDGTQHYSNAYDPQAYQDDTQQNPNKSQDGTQRYVETYYPHLQDHTPPHTPNYEPQVFPKDAQNEECNNISTNKLPSSSDDKQQKAKYVENYQYRNQQYSNDLPQDYQNEPLSSPANTQQYTNNEIQSNSLDPDQGFASTPLIISLKQNTTNDISKDSSANKVQKMPAFIPHVSQPERQDIQKEASTSLKQNSSIDPQQYLPDYSRRYSSNNMPQGSSNAAEEFSTVFIPQDYPETTQRYSNSTPQDYQERTQKYSSYLPQDQNGKQQYSLKDTPQNMLVDTLIKKLKDEKKERKTVPKETHRPPTDAEQLPPNDMPHILQNALQEYTKKYLPSRQARQKNTLQEDSDTLQQYTDIPQTAPQYMQNTAEDTSNVKPNSSGGTQTEQQTDNKKGKHKDKSNDEQKPTPEDTLPAPNVTPSNNIQELPAPKQEHKFTYKPDSTQKDLEFIPKVLPKKTKLKIVENSEKPKDITPETKYEPPNVKAKRESKDMNLQKPETPADERQIRIKAAKSPKDDQNDSTETTYQTTNYSQEETQSLGLKVQEIHSSKDVTSYTPATAQETVPQLKHHYSQEYTREFTYKPDIVPESTQKDLKVIPNVVPQTISLKIVGNSEKPKDITPETTNEPPDVKAKRESKDMNLQKSETPADERQIRIKAAKSPKDDQNDSPETTYQTTNYSKEDTQSLGIEVQEIHSSKDVTSYTPATTQETVPQLTHHYSQEYTREFSYKPDIGPESTQKDLEFMPNVVPQRTKLNTIENTQTPQNITTEETNEPPDVTTERKSKYKDLQNYELKETAGVNRGTLGDITQSAIDAIPQDLQKQKTTVDERRIHRNDSKSPQDSDKIENITKHSLEHTPGSGLGKKNQEKPTSKDASSYTKEDKRNDVLRNIPEDVSKHKSTKQTPESSDKVIQTDKLPKNKNHKTKETPEERAKRKAKEAAIYAPENISKSVPASALEPAPTDPKKGGPLGAAKFETNRSCPEGVIKETQAEPQQLTLDTEPKKTKSISDEKDAPEMPPKDHKKKGKKCFCKETMKITKDSSEKQDHLREKKAKRCFCKKDKGKTPAQYTLLKDKQDANKNRSDSSQPMSDHQEEQSVPCPNKDGEDIPGESSYNSSKKPSKNADTEKEAR